MEISHPNLPKVSGMVFVEVRSVVMLSTGHTASTRVLPMLANATMTGGDMAATVMGS